MEENKYTFGKIYKITNDIDNQIYIGSTCKKLKKRFESHISDFNAHRNKGMLLQQHMVNIGKEHFDIELIEDYECKCKDALLIRERYWIETLQSTLNINRPIRTEEEQREYQENYRNSHREYLNTMAHKYYHNNKIEIAKKTMLQRIVCECGIEVRKNNLIRHRKSKTHTNLLLTKNPLT
jgi:group I intron endonuclease